MTRAMTEPVNPQMVELARNARGLTQEELVYRASFTQATLSRIERGLSPVDADTLRELAEALHYPEAFFFQRGDVYAAKIKYARVRKSAGKKLLSRIDAENNIRARAIKELFKPFDFEVYDIPDLPIHPTYGTPEQVARALRERWRVPRGPIQNLTHLVEGKGLFVIHADFLGCPKLDGITYQFPDDVPDIIFLNKYAPADRMRFTLAHELGHRVMHWMPVGYAQAKKEADRFAAEFMAPAETIAPHLYKLNLQKLMDLKQYCRMSMAFFVYRARQLNTITERQAKYLRRKISEVSDGRKEPPETDISMEEPHMIKQLIRLHKENLDYTDDDLAAALRLSVDDFRRMFEAEKPMAKIYKLPNAAVAQAQ